MTPADASRDYLMLAKEMLANRISKRDLARIATRLPPLDETLLNKLAQIAEYLANSKPRHGWMLMWVAKSAAIVQHQSLFLRSLALWYLGRTANHWAQPKCVTTAIERARRGFVKLNEAGWISACDWQLNDQPWTKPDFAQTARSLKQALEGLKAAGFDNFVPHCRLALAYAQILNGESDGAMDNISASEAFFAARGDRLNQVHCWFHEASDLRRNRDSFDLALKKLEQALGVLKGENAPVDRARAYYYIGLCHLLKTENLSAAIEHFKRASDLFSLCELDLWRAMCISNLGAVYLFTGELSSADKYLEDARKVFLSHEIPSLLTDNLHDLAEVNILRGRPDLSIQQFEQALALYEKIGSRQQAAIAATNLGKAYGQNGRYQDALAYLEWAAEHLKFLGNHFRLGTCKKYSALIWSQLGQPEIAHEHLDHAIGDYELADHKAMLSEVYNYRAAVFFQQGKGTDGVDCLQKSLVIAKSFNIRPQAALARRLLGEGLTQIGKFDEALENLKLAQAEFANMGMMMEEAASFVAMGTCYALTSHSDLARDAFETALRQCQGVLPEIEWRVHIGLGNLAESESQVGNALQSYRQGVETLAQIRRKFWQPTLAGSYLQSPSRILDRIVSTAANAGASPDTLFFIECGKASTLLGQLLSENLPQRDVRSPDLAEVEAEIALLQERLRVSLDEPLPVRAKAEYQQMRAKLSEKTQEYGVLKARLERTTHSSQVSANVRLNTFSLETFRELANNAMERSWIALDYYLLNSQLVIIVITADSCEVVQSPVSYRCEMALDACSKAQRNSEPLIQSDLDVLGNLLIPDILRGALTPDTFLLLAPHRKLHIVPWAALRPSFLPAALVSISAPSIVPSLQILAQLWQRSESNHTLHRDAGLLIGVSDFQGRHRELPYVKHEIAALRSKLGPMGEHLDDEKVIWQNLLNLSSRQAANCGRGLSRFAWFHIATHFFSDALTGRLSGLALWDGDLRIDKMRDLAPLPTLVTLSTCNSNASFVYEGEEHVDMPSTCLIAGTNTVIGSIWPVLDEAGTGLMSAFYDHYLAGSRAAEALAKAQREIIEDSTRLDRWASYVCMGMP